MTEVPAVPVVATAISSGMYHNDLGEHVWYAKLTIRCPKCLAKHRILVNGIGESIPTLFQAECQRGGGKIEVKARN